MRNIWAFVALLRLADASSHAFNVLDDLLSYPQYEIVFSDDVIAADDPKSLTRSGLTPSTSYLPEHSQSANLQDTAESRKEPEIRDYELMNLRGIEYLCSIPVVNPPNTTKEEHSPEEQSSELVRATARGWELVKEMEGQCIYFVSGWWSYSFCFNDGVKQFHPLSTERGGPAYPPIEDSSVDSYVLGVFPEPSDGKGYTTSRRQSEETGLAKLETRGEKRYLVQKLGGGTQCDLTGRERRIEVQFHCSPQAADQIGLIKEVATCSYLMVIKTPRLCNDIAFLPPKKEKPNPITCRAVLPEEELKEFEAMQQEAQQQASQSLVDLQTALEQAPPKYPIAGGVEIGAKKWVGMEGKVLEKGEILGGGTATFITTVASSKGVNLTPAELKKLKITNTDELEIMKAGIERAARDHEWKIDLYEVRRGLEYRAEIKPKKKTGAKKDKESQSEGQNGNERDSEPLKEEEEQEGSEETYKEEL
ncbi:hypothetical protein P152DRAFT_456964 [Eremomyces bilateralis CBS 781.70]|uniref:Endoplasmic reticulum lectin n=1 Tax=Eremomyces bilateralis CBS 781.70 TaxID=1392243 RepID=A0A6G1G6D7_9PEZI|nr:uncharacterized protein P152DRAFT_456964 [Eremomyces bilateralis CBS 781.70]KAF1813582.1 hypothetical protein P152DRAFT_456964 [Eremomyces bilateralis CBS 781.70]